MHLSWTAIFALLAIHSAMGVDLPPEMQLEALPEVSVAPADNPTTPAKVKLGRLLFFDPILSATHTVACATCHHPDFGWGDGRATPIGVGGEGIGPTRKLAIPQAFALLVRNSPSLLNVAFNGAVSGKPYDPVTAPMFWDGRGQGLEIQTQAPLRSLEEMRGENCSEAEAIPSAVRRLAAVKAYQTPFAQAFPGQAPAINATNLAQALAAFERTLIAPHSPFDAYKRGQSNALSALQKEGMTAFLEAGCAQCHGGPMFSDFKLHFIGTPDASPMGRREFRTPTLRNLKHTAPYMHNGSMRRLDDVLAFYEQLGDAASEALDGADGGAQPRLDPLLRKLDLRPDRFPAILAFLEALNDDDYDKTIPAAVPSGLPPAGGNYKP